MYNNFFSKQVFFCYPSAAEIDASISKTSWGTIWQIIWFWKNHKPKDVAFDIKFLRIYLENYKIKNFCTSNLYLIWGITCISQAGYYIPFERLLLKSCRIRCENAWINFISLTDVHEIYERKYQLTASFCFRLIFNIFKTISQLSGRTAWHELYV